jgi:hypothetical protein
MSTTGVPSNTSIGPIFTRVPSVSYGCQQATASGQFAARFFPESE